MRRAALILGLILTVSLTAAPRRHAAAPPAPTPADATPQRWLAENAHVLSSIELTPSTADLFPLRAMIGSAHVVGLGDITHGTHEFYTVKLRVVDMLVREMGFDVIAFEAPFPLVERINTYVQTGVGDPRALLGEMYPLTYFFWDAEEILDVVEWMRNYNVHRGGKPPLQIVGLDVTQPDAASNAVVAYLRNVDPVAAVDAEREYACARESSLIITNDCRAVAAEIFDALLAREHELTALSTSTQFHDALHNARVVVQARWPFGPNRDRSLADNVLWFREHRGVSGKIILWAHSAHLSEAANASLGNMPMGRVLAETLESDYFSLTTMTAAGQFRQWEDPDRKREFVGVTQTFGALDPSAYESYFRQAGQPYLLIPFRKALPQWLATPTRYNLAGSTGREGSSGPIALQYDAAIFIDTTTPLRPLH
jgi:erythromycin esterase